ncbi:spermidine synthase [Paenibacillus arenilitoris]|uniref:Fused MFS/spermidine synthase n=1 Tax=Paenibacillus arenilitoris TaxID=2772299 RepID=A0A927CJH1_9BACL|nr:fused MFS/spermidine synthase [Paenibacillus arenilitoris]MBD2868242.1 fused MFS/spermidine synthase [Paenibacillus arenilitoris]
MHQLAKERSAYQEITVFEASELYGKTGKYRLLQFSDDAVQGAMDLKDPSRIVLEYPRAIIHLMERNDPSFARAFMIGHGIGTIAGRYPDKRFTVAEIDDKVVELSRRYFDYRMDNVVIGDGRALLGLEDEGILDYVIVDAFTKDGTPARFASLEFFRMAASKLAFGGTIIMNLAGRARNDKYIDAVYTTLTGAFAYTKAYALPGSSASDKRNVILAGSGRPIDCEPREMAGFREIGPDPGHLITDRAAPA